MYVDDVVTKDGDLVHFYLFANIEPLNVEETLREKTLRKAMFEELKSIKKNQT